MASSDITVTALTATPTLRGNKLAWTYSDPRNNALLNIGLDMVEVHASTTNDRTTATKVGEGITDFTHAGLVEEQTWYYWIKARDYLGGYGAWYPSGSTAGVSARAIGTSGLAFGLANGKLVATVASNALTIAVKTSSGNDPSPTDPFYCAIQSATAGSIDSFTITSALSVVVPSGANLGTSGLVSVPFALWVALANNAGVLKLVVALRSYSSTPGVGTIYSLRDGQAVTAKALGGAFDNNGSLLHAGTTWTVPSPIRLLGWLEFNSGLVTPGVWNVAPDVRPAAFGLVPGKILQEYSTQDASFDTTTNLIPWDNTIPQIGEGKAWIAGIGLVPQSAANWFEFDITLNCAHSVASEVVVAVFRDSAADAIGSGVAYVPAANEPAQIKLGFRVLAGSLTGATFDIRYGPSVAGTMTINGAAGAGKLNGTLFSKIILRELAA